MRLHVQDSGAGPDSCLVFLHAFPLNHTLWDAQSRWARAHFRVIAYDHRGHGQSETGSGQYAFESFVDDLFAVLDERGIKKTILCGLSMGGYVALRAVERAPERVQALVLCDTRSEADGNEAKLKRAATVKIIQDQGVPVFCEGFLKSALAPEAWAGNTAVLDHVRGMILQNSPAGITGAVLALAGRTDTTESLSRIRVPTLILVGEQDVITPPAAAQALQQKITGARLAVIPKAGHFSNLENPDAFNGPFQEFLKSII